MLENLKIAKPCPADWNAMTGDDRVRFCALCKLNVYNLSGMKRAEAEKLIADKEGQVCVRLYQRADGTVLTADCPVGVAALKRRVASLVSAGVGLVALTWSVFTFGFRREAEAAEATPNVRPETTQPPRNTKPPVQPVRPQPGDRVLMGAPMPPKKQSN